VNRVALIDFQSALGQMVQDAEAAHRAPANDLSPDERVSLAHLARSAGLRVTTAIQRSWCEGRAAKTARVTLSALPVEERRDLLERWVNAGGGKASFFEAEAKAFLAFIAQELPVDSPARVVCEIERATICASEGVADFTPPQLPTPDASGILRPGRYASLVRIAAETAVLFAPGLDGLCRPATDAEASFWQRLAATPSRPEPLGEGSRLEMIVGLISVGAVDYEPG
jgi:hypothetical protein